MNFDDLESEKTLVDALSWIATCVQNALDGNRPSARFTFNKMEGHSLEEVFQFILKIRDYLIQMHFKPWVILDNKKETIALLLRFGEES